MDTRRRRAFREILVLAEINVSVILLLSSSVAARSKKDGDREHPGDFHQKNLLRTLPESSFNENEHYSDDVADFWSPLYLRQHII